ncbi:MAG TPA: PilN domain-containing protein [Longimicrobiales bacterium]|nr:PilN domain-containing protein [Longimicrobiales bacterium]
MIEVNLLPGGKKRSSKGRGVSLKGFSLPSFGKGGGGFSMPGDPYQIGAAAAGIVTLAVVGWLFMGLRSDREEVQVAVDAAVQDSMRFADLIQRTNQLTARRDSIGQRVAIIQEIDAGRYVWPHILDEIARALPDYTWLREVMQVQEDPLQIRIAGTAGSNFAITSLMRNLEASPFLRGVLIERTEQTPSEENPDDIVYVFELVVTFESPPLDELETIPLFENDLTGVLAAASDTTGGR